MYTNNNYLIIGLLISLGAHGMLIAGLPHFSLDHPQKKDTVEVIYVKPKPEPVTMQKREGILKDPVLAKQTAIVKPTPPPFVKPKEETAKVEKESAKKPEVAIAKTPALEAKPAVTIPEVEQEKIKNPSYLSYYQLIRERIKRSAYQLYSSRERGEVYVSFIVRSNGQVIDTDLIEAKSSSNLHLRDIALRSIRNAAPFPLFPKELNYPDLSFNILITFGTEEN